MQIVAALESLWVKLYRAMKNKIVVTFTNSKVFVDYSDEVTSLEVLSVLNDAVSTMYIKALREESEKVNKTPECIQHLLNLIRKQRNPESN